MSTTYYGIDLVDAAVKGNCINSTLILALYNRSLQEEEAFFYTLYATDANFTW